MSRPTKTILALVLVVILLGIAYIEALLSSQGGPDGKGGSTTAAAAVHDGFLSEDHVAGLVDSVRQYYVDSLFTVFADSLATISSASTANSPDVTRLASAKDSLTNANERLATKLGQAREEIAKLVKDRDSQVITLANAFYKNELAALPADLTNYEKSVSVKEIKDKLQRYFNLSSKQVKRIADKYK